MDENLASSLQYELAKYKEEIKMWIQLSDNNDKNRIQTIRNQRKALTQTLSDFAVNCLGKVTLEVNDKKTQLLTSLNSTGTLK